MPAYAGVVELADARDSKSRVRKDVRVRPPPPAPKSRSAIGAARFCIVQQGGEPEGSWQSAGALCNLRRPAPQRRSTPATGTINHNWTQLDTSFDSMGITIGVQFIFFQNFENGKQLDKCTGNRYNYGSNYYLCGFYKILNMSIRRSLL